MSDRTPIIQALKRREYAKSGRLNRSKFPKIIDMRLDKSFNKIIQITTDLRSAIASLRWDQIENAIADIFVNLLDGSNATPARERKQQRDIFVSIGGLQLLLSVFKPPFMPSDGRLLKESVLIERLEVLNEVLLILREVGYAATIVTENVYNDSTVVMLFTLLAHHTLFDNTISLLEEIVAYREEVFGLALIPKFYELIEGLNARYLGAFCRVLSLLVFEPEDRQIMEGVHLLQSSELLQLRRNRMSKSAQSIVERNQCLIMEMPGFLEHLVQILRVINHGPHLHDYLRYNIVANLPMSGDILKFRSTEAGHSDWIHFVNLERIIASAGPSNPSSTGSATAGVEAAVNSENQEALEEMMQAFSARNQAPGVQSMDLNNLISILQLAQSLGAASITPLGMALLTSVPNGLSNLTNANRRISRSQDDPVRAKRELQFHSMLLLPYQVEVIFVLCTLLSGRRKLVIQDRLAALNLGEVLLTYNRRLSWSKPPTYGRDSDRENVMEHVHGPNCECNPESALRIQVLRLVHNFVDRDFLGNYTKLQLFSADEIESLHSVDLPPEEAAVPFHTESGLLISLIETLVDEPNDSVYRFWLCACVENFLRGCGGRGQLFIASYVVSPKKSMPMTFLKYLLLHLITVPPSANNTYQTIFDLLGELTKSNRTVFLMLQDCLDEEQLTKMWTIVGNNLIDSNVFLRSIYLSLDMLAGTNETSNTFAFYANHLRTKEDMFMDVKGSPSEPQMRHFYLPHTFVQFAPRPLLQRAVDIHIPTPSFQGNGSSSGGSGFSTRVSVLRQGVLGAVQSVTSKILGLTSPSRKGSISKESEPIPASSSSSGNSGGGSVNGTETGCSSSGMTSEYFQRHAHVRDYHSTTVVPPSLCDGSLSQKATKDKLTLLLKLMCVVSLETVTHENLCVLNSTLLMLLLSYSRGELSTTLATLKDIANEEYRRLKRKDSFDIDYSDKTQFCGVCEPSGINSSAPGGNSSCACSCGKVAGGGSVNSLLKSFQSSMTINSNVDTAEPAEGVGARIVMANFRRLLWYWSEYYLRRGRDRLSVEFSCHAPFSYWVKLVGLLCKDDGSDTALLSSPVKLAPSPFSKPPVCKIPYLINYVK